MTQNALILTTSHARLGTTDRATGFYWEELAGPYWILRDAGIDVSFASVKGGEPPADPNSAKEENRPAPVQRFMDDDKAMDALANSQVAEKVDPSAFDLIFLPGGHGTMWDLAAPDPTGNLIGAAYEAGAIIGAVCHGPAGLVGATLSDGTPLVKGKRVNSFTDAEEEAVGLTEIMPFPLEGKLRELGCDFECNPDNFQAHAVRDGRLVTGQNPRSSEPVAKLLLEALEENANS